METNLTLQQGLELFNKKNNQYFSQSDYTQKGKKFMKSHDISHVLFGCDTTLYGEGVVKLWTTFGTNLSFIEVTKGYNEVAAFNLAKEFSLKHFMSNIASLLSVIPKVIFRAKKMSKPWPFFDFEAYLELPLADIRREFNIEVV